MNFRSRIKELFNRFNSKLNKGTRIAICSAVVVALLIGVIGIVNHTQQHETANTGEVATCPVGITVAKAEKDRSTGCKIKADEDNKSKTKGKESETKQADKNDKEEEKEAAVSTATPEATPSSKPEEKKEESPEQNKPASNRQNNKPASSNKSSNQKSSNGSAKQNQANQKSCKVVNHPAVTHQEPVYTTVHHDAVTHQEPVYTQVQTGTKTVVDQAAYDERVSLGDREVCCVCGATFPTGSNQAPEHIMAVHDWNGRYTVQEVFQTVHHDAVTHQEPVYENQQTGTKTIVDKAAYDEKVQTGTKTVTDKAAWQETVCQ